jgi:hypothetical protein
LFLNSNTSFSENRKYLTFVRFIKKILVSSIRKDAPVPTSGENVRKINIQSFGVEFFLHFSRKFQAKELNFGIQEQKMLSYSEKHRKIHGIQ